MWAHRRRVLLAEAGELIETQLFNKLVMRHGENSSQDVTYARAPEDTARPGHRVDRRHRFE